MSSSQVLQFEVVDPLHGSVGCAAVVPGKVTSKLPLCLFLYGGGGGRDSLRELQPLLEMGWTSGALSPMVVATPDVGPWSFYLDDPARGLGWETFVMQRFLPHVQHLLDTEEDAGIGVVGISMGGYGALKMAFSHPREFAALAAISPMIEPAVEPHAVRLRNRYHYPPEVPQQLLGPERDSALYRRDHPASRAHANVDAVRVSDLAVYIDAAGHDALNAHDGAEYLHRVLWDLDLPHEYRLRRDADHVGPELLDRLLEAFAWVGRHLAPQRCEPLTEQERAWEVWLAADRRSVPPAPLPPTSHLFPRVLRAQLEPLRAEAERSDTTFARRYGLLACKLTSPSEVT